MKATYHNKVLDETYTLAGVNGLEQAWHMADFVCRRNNWNPDMFCDDVKVTVK